MLHRLARVLAIRVRLLIRASVTRQIYLRLHVSPAPYSPLVFLRVRRLAIMQAFSALNTPVVLLRQRVAPDSGQTCARISCSCSRATRVLHLHAHVSLDSCTVLKLIPVPVPGLVHALVPIAALQRGFYPAFPLVAALRVQLNSRSRYDFRNPRLSQRVFFTTSCRRFAPLPGVQRKFAGLAGIVAADVRQSPRLFFELGFCAISQFLLSCKRCSAASRASISARSPELGFGFACQ